MLTQCSVDVAKGQNSSLLLVPLDLFLNFSTFLDVFPFPP